MEQRELFDPGKSTETSETEAGRGKARLLSANRQQVEMHIAALDSLIAEDHRVWVVWEMVQAYDLSRLYEQIGSVEGGAGRPAIDPRILVAVWSPRHCPVLGGSKRKWACVQSTYRFWALRNLYRMSRF